MKALASSTDDRSAVHRRQSSVHAGTFTIGGLAGEFGDEGLHLVDRSNAATLGTGDGPGCPFPPHGASRRGVHPHGSIHRGTFESSGEAAHLSDAPQLAEGAITDATVRTSNFVHHMDRADVMGLAVKLESSDGTWDMVATSIPIFIVPTMAGFRSVNLLATKRRFGLQWGRFLLRSLLNRMSPKAFFKMQRAQRRRTIGRLTSTYWGVHTFRLTRAERNGSEASEYPFRYRWEPVTASRSEAVFDLWFDVVKPGWRHMNKATKSPRRRDIEVSIRAGRLTITGDETDWDTGENPTGEDEVLFLPTRLPPGIGTSDDELLFVRGAAYQLSYLRRTEGR